MGGEGLGQQPAAVQILKGLARIDFALSRAFLNLYPSTFVCCPFVWVPFQHVPIAVTDRGLLPVCFWTFRSTHIQRISFEPIGGALGE